jgi:hypothetical protein
MGVVAPVALFLIEKYVPEILVKGYCVDGIIMATLGGIFNAIFTAGRASRTPALSNSCAAQGGLQFASLINTAVFGLLFGFIATALLRCFNPRQSINKDGMLWFIDQ